MSNFLTLPEPPPLPPAPLLDRLLFEQPMYLMAPLIVGAIIAFLVLNSKGRARHAIIAAGVMLALAAATFLIARLVTTDRERIQRRAADLVHATARGDGQAVGPMLFPSVVARRISVGEMDREAIVARVREYFAPGGTYPIREYALLDVRAGRDGPNVGRAQVKVRVTPADSGLPTLSWWVFHYQRDDDGAWRVVSFEPTAANFPGLMQGQ